jgi:hypothetical protein
MRWARHVAPMWGMRNAHKITSERIEKRDNWEEIGADERILVKLLLWLEVVIGLAWLLVGYVKLIYLSLM